MFLSHAEGMSLQVWGRKKGAQRKNQKTKD
jgi:hypothetical protein